MRGIGRKAVALNHRFWCCLSGILMLQKETGLNWHAKGQKILEQESSQSSREDPTLINLLQVKARTSANLEYRCPNSLETYGWHFLCILKNACNITLLVRWSTVKLIHYTAPYPFRGLHNTFIASVPTEWVVLRRVPHHGTVYHLRCIASLCPCSVLNILWKHSCSMIRFCLSSSPQAPLWHNFR